MKIEKLAVKNLKHEYSVTVPANDINDKTNKKLVDLSKKVSMPGFRKGKVPLDVVKKKYQQDVMGEVLNDVVNEYSTKAITENKLKPATQPKVEITEFEEGKDLKFNLSVEVLPEVPEVKLEKLKVKKTKADISDADINKILEDVSKNYKNHSPAPEGTKAKLGDAVLIDFKGFLNDVPFPGGEGKDFKLELGSNTFIPGFEDQLVGVKKGDQTKVNVTFPAEYHSKDLAGQPTVFEINVKDVLTPAANEINDEFAKQLGQKSVEDLKATVKSNLEMDAADMSRVLIKKELFDALEKEVKFDLPSTMVDAELNSIIRQIKSSSDYNAGHVHTENCDHSKEDEDLKKEYEKLAKRRVMLGILVTDIAAKNKIDVTKEEINKALFQEASRYPGQEQQVIEFFKKNPQAIQSLRGPILEEKIVDFILEKATIKEEPKSLEELRKLVLDNQEQQ